jgi:hypothetical protein
MDKIIYKDIVAIIKDEKICNHEETPGWEDVADRISLDYEEELYSTLKEVFKNPLKNLPKLQKLIETAARIELEKFYKEYDCE